MEECQMGIIEHNYIKPHASYFDLLYMMKPKYMNLRDDTLEKWDTLINAKFCEYCQKEKPLQVCDEVLR